MSTQRQHRRLDKVEDLQPQSDLETIHAPGLSDRALAKIAWPDGPPNGDSWDVLEPHELDTQINRALEQHQPTQ